MLNKQFFRLWILGKIQDLERKLITGELDTIEDAYMIKGKLEMLKELFDEYNLEDVSMEGIEYHSGY